MNALSVVFHVAAIGFGILAGAAFQQHVGPGNGVGLSLIGGYLLCRWSLKGIFGY